MVETETQQHRAGLEPRYIAERIDDLTLRDVVLLAGRVVAELGTTSEASGGKLQADRVNGGKPGSRAPTHAVVCDCRPGCASLQDHHKRRLADAWGLDAPNGGYPRVLRGAVLRAAQDLASARRGAKPDEVRQKHEDPSDRDEKIVSYYEGMSADAAATLESARAGHITSAAIRLARRRNGYHALYGRPLPQHDAAGQQAWALELVHSCKSQGEAARIIGVAQSTISRWTESPS